MKNPFVKKITKAFAYCVISLLVCSAISLITLNRADEKEIWVQHTHLVIQKLEYLLSVMKDAETGARGFIITKQPQTLAPYNYAEKVAGNALIYVKQLTRDNPQQQKSLGTLTGVIQTQFQILTRCINITKAGKQVNADEITNGKHVMDKARALIEQMKEREYHLLRVRNQSWKNTWGYIPFLIVLLTILSIVSTTYFCRNLKISYFEKVKFRRKLQQQGIITTNRISVVQGVTAQVAGGNYAIRLTDKESDTLGILATDINRMIVALDQSFRKLSEWMQKKDDFINITAHELRTPLTSIKATLQFIGRIKFDTQESKKIYPFVERANSQIKRLIKILNDLLDVSKVNTEQLNLNKSRFVLYDALQEGIEEIKAGNGTHEIILAGNSHTVVNADKLRIEQVITNLISNAIKYSYPNSKIHIEVEERDDFVKVAVTDQGIGIPQDKLPYIFERYFRVENTSQNYSGMGLGLYISKGIILQHHGQIGVESQQGKGTTFWFSLPLK